MSKWLSTKQVAKLTGFHPYTIRIWCKKGILECRQTHTNPEKGRGKRGGHLMIKRESIKEWMIKS